MSKVSKNQRVGQKIETPCYGPCVDCGAIDSRGLGEFKEPQDVPHFNSVKRYGPTGRAVFVRLCEKCVTRA